MKQVFFLLLLTGIALPITAQTRFGADTGEYGAFLSSLENQLVNSQYRERIKLAGVNRSFSI